MAISQWVAVGALVCLAFSGYLVHSRRDLTKDTEGYLEHMGSDSAVEVKALAPDRSDSKAEVPPRSESLVQIGAILGSATDYLAEAVYNIIPPTNGPGNGSEKPPSSSRTFHEALPGRAFALHKVKRPAGDNPEAVHNSIPPTTGSEKLLAGDKPGVASSFIAPTTASEKPLAGDTDKDPHQSDAGTSSPDFDVKDKYPAQADAGTSSNLQTEQDLKTDEVVMDRLWFLEQAEAARLNASTVENEDAGPMIHMVAAHRMHRTAATRRQHTRTQVRNRVQARTSGGSSSGGSSFTRPTYNAIPSTAASKTIKMLNYAKPPEWPSRLGTISFSANGPVTLRSATGGFAEIDPLGSPKPTHSGSRHDSSRPISSVTVEKRVRDENGRLVTEKSVDCLAKLRGKLEDEVPFNTQMEDIDVGGTKVKDFDRLIFGRDSEQAAGLNVGGYQIDFAVNWEVNMLKFAESVPIVAKHAYIGFGQDGTKVILDLGLAFYKCEKSCDYMGMLNFETEGNHPYIAYKSAWPGSPMPTPKYRRTSNGKLTFVENRKQRCTDRNQMCDGSSAYSGLLFKEKVQEVAEYSGEVLGGGGDGDDTFMFLDLEGLKSMGVTHAVLTGHVFTKQAIKDLDGAFYRISAGEVYAGKGRDAWEGLMDMVLYQDLDEALEPPTPDNPKGHQARSNAMMLGMFNLRSDDDWVFGEKPASLTSGSHWEYAVLNQPIKGKMLSESLNEVRDVIAEQLVKVPREAQTEVNEEAGKTEHLQDYEDDDDDDDDMFADLASMNAWLDKEAAKNASKPAPNKADALFKAMPGGLPGGSTRNYFVLPEEATFKINVKSLSGTKIAPIKKDNAYAKIIMNGVNLGKTGYSTTQGASVNLAAGSIAQGKTKLGVFPLTVEVMKYGMLGDSKVATLQISRGYGEGQFHPGTFTGNPHPFKQEITVGNDEVKAVVEVVIVSEEW